MDDKEQRVIDFIKEKGECSSKEVFDGAHLPVSYATLKRILAKLIDRHFLSAKGKGKGTKYVVSPTYEIIQPINIDKYYEKEIDDRKIKVGFNFSVITDVLASYSVFTEIELQQLAQLQQLFEKNISLLSSNEYKKELERLSIDLSWKSSQIEGNTYSLLETEKLLKEKETAPGKTKEEAIMLLNHKYTLDFIIDNTDYLYPLTVSKIEDIHSMLVKELGVDRNIRKRRVGISGTNYRPLENEFQIAEALQNACNVINNKKSVFEKALLALVLISYIQPFMDGNKRTARIVSNAILMNAGYCPLSFRTVDSIDYKKAMLLFYEQNNISNFKRIFIEQFDFAVKAYF
ncbi:Fic family protein [Agriterribacter sp.]|uniref:Fic family protein n=1 Tax=Agriterribacter sp. TaxID=2821509 RepID=UPI002C1AC2B4|nr:Fic family protein [Agriterribacter sp.]HRP54708.1 Fic family protein [Agriterribacter sp.]